jgi:hypothetical protein
LDVNKNHIWSSATLYPAAIGKKRASWFHTFMDQNYEISESKMYDFHRYTEEGTMKMAYHQ